MKNPFARAVAALAAIAALAPAVQAQEGVIVQRVEITASRAALDAAKVVIADRDFDTTYGMSTGRLLTVTQHGQGALQLRYGHRLPAIVRHDGQGVFVSVNGQWALQFALDATGEPTSVRLSMPADRL